MTEAVSCVPVSWLRMEQYALGELTSPERAEIAGHLAACDRCRARADAIEHDVRALQPLAEPALAPTRKSIRRRHQRWAAWAVAAAVVAVASLRPADEPLIGGRRIAVKGGEVTIELVRERNGSVAWEPDSFTAGDRFKLLLTCAPPLRVYADLVVLQADGPAFPAAPSTVVCGNRVPLATAFRITGAGAAAVCVAVDPVEPPSRARLAAGAASGATSPACLHLDRGR